MMHTLDRYDVKYTHEDISALAGGNRITRMEIMDKRFSRQESYLENRDNIFQPHHFAKVDLKTAVAPGLPAFLINLRQKHIPCVICTNSTADRIQKGLKIISLNQYFQKIYSGAEEKHNKPDPYIYLKAMSDFHVAPDKTMIFEDSQVGIAGAKKSGAFVCALLDPDHFCIQDAADARISSFSEADQLMQDI